MSRTVRGAAVTAILAIAAPAPAAGPSCLGDFQWIAEGLPREAGRKITKAYGSFNPAAQKGVVAVLAASPAVERLDPETLAGILDKFPSGLEIDANALGTNEALFEAIGELTGEGAEGLTMRPGLVDTVAALGGDFFEAAQGATFDLFMARRLGYDNVVSLETRINTPGTGWWRMADVVEACRAPCPGFPGIQHENKNFLSDLFAHEDELADPDLFIEGGRTRFKYSDGRLTSLADEFARDILKHHDSGYAYLRLNIRGIADTAEQRRILRQVLEKQFEAPIVVAQFPVATVREAMAAAFLDELDSILRLYPLR